MTNKSVVSDQLQSSDVQAREENNTHAGDSRKSLKGSEGDNRMDGQGKQNPVGSITPRNDIERNDAGLNPILNKMKDEQIKEYRTKDSDSCDEHENGTENAALMAVDKTEDMNNLIECKEESVLNSPRLFSPSDAYGKRSRSKSRQKLEDRVNRTPFSCKKEKYDVRRNITPECSPRKLRKRKVSHISDYDQLSDTTKAEMLDTSYFNDFEAIDLLHDLDTVMDFEDTKISSDILLSSMTFNTVKQDDMKENYSENGDDPPVDPLFIANYDEKTGYSTNATCMDYSEESEDENKGTEPTYVERKPGKYNMRTLKVKKTNDLCKLTEMSEDEELNESAREKLYNLEVELVHTVPPQHKIEQSAGSVPPTQTQKRLFSKFGPLRKGTFSPTEDCIIRNNWNMFCKTHNWKPKHVKPFLYMKHGNKFVIGKLRERQKFVQFLANGIPWRTLYSVYHRFRKLYEKRENMNSRYSAAEDKQILAYAEKSKHQKGSNQMYATLAKLLGRSRHSVWLRHQTLKKSQQNVEIPATKVEWTLPLIEKFIKHLLCITLSENLEELKDATIPKPVWQKLEEKLSIDNGVLKAFWVQQLHMQLFCPHPIYLNDIKIKLIEYIYGKGISNTREIIWPNVAKYFEGVTTVFLCKVFFHLVREISSKTLLTNFTNIVEYLYQEKIAEIRADETDKYLPRLSYENGKAKIVDDDINSYAHVE